MKKIRKSLSLIPQKFLGAFGADFTITRSDVFMTFAAVSKNIRPVQPTSRRSKQTIHLRSNSELVQDVLRGRAVVARGAAAVMIFQIKMSARRRREFFLSKRRPRVDFLLKNHRRGTSPNTIFLKENPFWEGFASKIFAPAARFKKYYI